MTNDNPVFLRHNAFAPDGDPPSRYTEAEVRALLAASIRNVDRSIARLKKGYEVKTPYATYRLAS